MQARQLRLVEEDDEIARLVGGVDVQEEEAEQEDVLATVLRYVIGIVCILIACVIAMRASSPEQFFGLFQ